MTNSKTSTLRLFLFSFLISIAVFAGESTGENKSLYSYLPLDEGTGNVANDLARGLKTEIKNGKWVKGELTECPQLNFDNSPLKAEIEKRLKQERNPGKDEWALEFDGKDTYVKVIPGMTSEIAGEFTLEAWVRAIVQGGDPSIIEQSLGNPPVGLRLGLLDRKLLAVVSRDSKTSAFVACYCNGRSIFSEATAIDDSNWHHVIFTYSIAQNKQALYLDGEKIKIRWDEWDKNKSGMDASASNPLFLPDSTMTISGVTPFPNSYGQFQGIIRGVKIYSRALSDEDVKNEFLETIPVYARYKFLTSEEKAKKEATSEIRARILDEKTGEPLDAQVYVKVNDRFYVTEDNLYWGYYGNPKDSVFVATGKFDLKIPEGKATVIVTRGFEYFPAIFDFDIKKSEVKNLDVALKRLVDMPSYKWWAGGQHEHNWGHGRGKLYDKFMSKDGWKYYADAQKAVGFNYASMPGSGCGGNCKSVWTDKFITWSTGEHQVCYLCLGYDKLIYSKDIVAKLEALREKGKNGLIQGYKEDALQPGQVATAFAFELVDAWRANESDWYKYLNMGFKCCIGQGSDYYFTYGLRHSIPKEYTRMDTLTWENMINAYKGHCSFWTSGPLVLFKINDNDIGSTVKLFGSKAESLDFMVKAWHIYGIEKIELIKNGKIEKTFTFEGLPKEVSENFKLDVDNTCWYLVKVYAKAGKFAGPNAITSPVYVQFGDNPMRGSQEDINAILKYLDDYVVYLEKTDDKKHDKIKEKADAERARKIYEGLSNNPRTWN